MRRHPALAVLALAALPLSGWAAGCGGSDTGAPVATTEVRMAKSYRFDPPRIQIDAGETVTWTNDDNFTHTVQVDGQADHAAGPGERVTVTFDVPGTYHYVCTLHRRDMDGEVIVK